MKTVLRLGWIIPVLALCAACSGGDEGFQTIPTGNQAIMTGLTIETAARVAIAIPSVPDPIDSLEWDDESFDLAGASVAIAPLQRPEDTILARFRPAVSFGARVLWGIGSIDTPPFAFTDIRVPATFEDSDYIYFKITSQDGATTNYYRFAIWVRSPIVELAEVYIGLYETHKETNAQGTEVTIVDKDERMMATVPKDSTTGQPLNGSADLATTIALTTPGVLAIREDQADQAKIIVTPKDSQAKIRYGLTSTSSAAPEFRTSNIFDLTDYTFLYIEVTAENTVDVAFYKYRVEVGRIASIKTLTFVGKDDAEFDIANTGELNVSWGSVALGNFKTADMPDAGFGIKYAADDPGATVSWTLISNKNAANPGSFSSPSVVQFNGTNVLALRVVSKNTRATRYYKIEVELLAAAFKEQPKSDYYYYYNTDTWVGDSAASEGPNKINWYDYARLTKKPFKPGTEEEDKTVPFNPSQLVFNSSDPNFTTKGESQVVPLSFVLDRLGTFTYQWYEANSWYGGYGFDATGKILYYPTGNPDAVSETGFVQDAYHRAYFDEKKNVSFHNGGNEFYRLEYPGRKIDGATGATYTPSINKRPFMDGFTSETHYYWVEVTDSQGRKAVSKRAAIVSERDPRKKHHIVNLSDPSDPNSDLKVEKKDGAVVWPGTARNQTVFKVKRETYKIPVTFPSDFNVNDYTVATVQALFFLIDGTPWIQNWTQGDIGFEDADGGQLIYYNLTNNNGTLGLVGGGKEPGGGSLTKTPKYLIVKPAGEKPTNEKPPFENDGVTPKPNNNAQGWFCGFIELVEVRFEGPPR